MKAPREEDAHCCARCPKGYRCDRCVNAILDGKNAVVREAWEYLKRAEAAEAECARLRAEPAASRPGGGP